ncbi:MAG: hypothetical protein ABI036_04375 [Fibrobacteria bacterium]
MHSLCHYIFRSSFRQRPVAARTLATRTLSALVAVCAFFGCDMQTAGTSVGTGNPTEIEVAFKNDSGSVSITGTMEVYAATQIPVPGFSPDPLIRVPVSGLSHATLQAEALAALPDSLWPATSVENGLYRFNVVVTGETEGSILKGFALRKDSGDFVLEPKYENTARHPGSAPVRGGMEPLVSIACTIDTAMLVSYYDDYLFLYGTGFKVKADAGSFVFPSIPKGEYDAFLLSLPGRGQGGIGVDDSLLVYGLSMGIAADKPNVLALTGVQATVPVPEPLKH